MNEVNEDILDFDEFEEIAGKISEINVQHKEFKPWHKPRKQWVRACQWKNELRHLMDESCYKDINTIKYFSFPGEDCLDIKILSTECDNKGKKFYFQGIESSSTIAQKAQNVILSKLFDLKYIDKTSSLHANSSFEEIGVLKSSLYSKIVSSFPFHILNFDFTNSIFADPKTMQSICALLNRQFDQQYLKWQLYLTTRCNIETINTEILKEYMSLVLKNCKNNKDFTDLLKEKIYKSSTEDFSIENLMTPKEQFEKVVIIAFLKWLIALTIEKKVSVTLLSSAEYTVRDDATAPDMISLVFQFEKSIQPIDPTRINFSNDFSVTEPKAACKICTKFLNRIKNIDILLKEKPDLTKKLTEDIKSMLGNLGYDISKYPYG